MLAANAEHERSNRGAELLGLSAFALALMLLIALATFDPHDPAPFFKAGAEGTARNFIGPFGAFLAEMLIPQLFGLAALLLPLALGLAGWKLFWCRPIEAPYTKAVGNLFLLLRSPRCSRSLSAPSRSRASPCARAERPASSLAGLLVADFGRTGAYIVAATGLFVALILSTQFSFSALLKGTSGRVGERLRALRTAFAHYRESRRKEKLRREVIRKHAAAREGARGPAAHQAASRPDDDEPEAEPSRRRTEAEDDLPLQAADDRRAARAEAAALRRRRTVDAEPSAPAPSETQPVRSRRRRTALEAAAAATETRGSYTLPPLTILDQAKGGAMLDNDRLLERGKILQLKSAEFGVMGTVREIHPGPVVTTYEFKPDAGVKYSKIVGLADDLALALEAESIRIDRVSGKGNVGIEIPNEVRETIYLREVLESEIVPARLGPADARTRQGRERRRLGDGPRHHAAPADRRLDRHRQERRPQLHDRLDPVPLDAGRGADDPDRPQAARARRLRGHPAPADARRHRPQGRRQRAQVGGRRDGAAHPHARLRGRAQHRAVQQHHPRRHQPSGTTRAARSCARCTTS